MFKFIKSKKSKDEKESLIEKESVDNIVDFIEQLPKNYTLDKNKLEEITDSDVLSLINAAIPAIGSIGKSIETIIKNNSSQLSEQLYKVVLQKGGTLVDSLNMDGAKRAFTYGNNGIKENANLVPVNAKTGVDIATMGAAAMNLASMVVGQYYMNQVESRLKTIGDSLSRVAGFLDIQYKSQVASLIESVYNASKFQMSSIKNNELRNRELDNIQQLRQKNQELLNHSEAMLEKLSENNGLNYKEYVDVMKEIKKWYQYQTILRELLYQINVLDFTLHVGIKSNEQCFGTFNLHLEKADAINKQLLEWHKAQCESLKIDLIENRRKHTGILSLLEKPISLINDNWNYLEIDKNIINTIKIQTSNASHMMLCEKNLFDNNVEIIIEGDKFYYLPQLN